LQDPPELIPHFVELWKHGWQVVYGLRKTREESPWKKALYWIFYRLLGNLASVQIPLDAGDFALIDRMVVNSLKSFPERRRFLRGLRAWTGFCQIGVEYDRPKRFAGKPKYTWAKLMRLAIDGLLSFSATPLRLATATGLFVSAGALLGIVVVL